MDVSHRGGPAGFVQPDGAGGFLLPDYVGNFYFNTLGNLALQPRCGLLFIDVEAGDLLQVCATVTVSSDAEVLADLPGAQRVLRIEPGRALRRRGALPLSWGAVEASREVQQIASMMP